LPGSEARILREGNFLPLEQDEKSRELLEAYGHSAGDLGFQVAAEATGGSLTMAAPALAYRHPITSRSPTILHIIVISIRTIRPQPEVR